MEIITNILTLINIIRKDAETVISSKKKIIKEFKVECNRSLYVNLENCGLIDGQFSISNKIIKVEVGYEETILEIITSNNDRTILCFRTKCLSESNKDNKILWHI